MSPSHSALRCLDAPFFSAAFGFDAAPAVSAPPGLDAPAFATPPGLERRRPATLDTSDDEPSGRGVMLAYAPPQQHRSPRPSPTQAQPTPKSMRSPKKYWAMCSPKKRSVLAYAPPQAVKSPKKQHGLPCALAQQSGSPKKKVALAYAPPRHVAASRRRDVLAYGPPTPSQPAKIRAALRGGTSKMPRTPKKHGALSYGPPRPLCSPLRNAMVPRDVSSMTLQNRKMLGRASTGLPLKLVADLTAPTQSTSVVVDGAVSIDASSRAVGVTSILQDRTTPMDASSRVPGQDVTMPKCSATDASARDAGLNFKLDMQMPPILCSNPLPDASSACVVPR